MNIILISLIVHFQPSIVTVQQSIIVTFIGPILCHLGNLTNQNIHLIGDIPIIARPPQTEAVLPPNGGEQPNKHNGVGHVAPDVLMS